MDTETLLVHLDYLKRNSHGKIKRIGIHEEKTQGNRH